jgi:drug/metabolite transporter (DMT)-like permease
MPQKAPGIALFVVGVVFIAIGSSGNRVLFGVGAAFVVVGVVALARRRQAGGDPP